MSDSFATTKLTTKEHAYGGTVSNCVCVVEKPKAPTMVGVKLASPNSYDHDSEKIKHIKQVSDSL